MRPEVLPHAHFQDRRVVFGVQPATVDDADASMAAVLTVLDESSHAGERVGSRLAVQVAPVADAVFAVFQFPNLAPIDALRDEIVL